MSISRRSFLQFSTVAALSRFGPRFAATDSPDIALCRKLGSDPLRPQYHLLPAHNWMNDPNGPIFYRGRYHMFHQYNPQAAVWGNMNWAHATSPDMIRWHHEPIAISPTPGGPDQDGVFSGSAVLDNGQPTVIYTAVAPPKSDAEATLRDGHHTWRETQCLAVAQDDDLRTWKKVIEPVISAPPEGLKVLGFRDPCLWREGDKWTLILGSGTRDKGGMILLYSSPDLRRWTYLHPLVEGAPSGKDSTNPVDTGDMWECPDFFPLGNKHVLLISTMGKVRWKVGSYANQRFTPEKEGVVDWGSYYAAKTMLDRNGTRILWGWIPETRPDADLIAAGWAGAMSLPRVVSLNSQNELQTDVAPAITQLRGAHSNISRGPSEHPSNGAESRSADVSRETSLAGSQPTARIFPIENLSAELRIKFRTHADDFTIRLQSRSGEDFATISASNVAGNRQLRVNDFHAILGAPEKSPTTIRMFLDGSILELFVNQTTSLTARIYKTPSAPLALTLTSNADLDSLDGWQMTPLSKDRLTGSMCR